MAVGIGQGFAHDVDDLRLRYVRQQQGRIIGNGQSDEQSRFITEIGDTGSKFFSKITVGGRWLAETGERGSHLLVGHRNGRFHLSKFADSIGDSPSGQRLFDSFGFQIEKA